MVTERPILLFDVMGTLVSEPFFEHVPAFFDMTLEELFRVKHPSSWIEFEHGRIDEATYARQFFADGRPINLEGLKNMMQRTYEWLDGMETLVARLSDAGYALHTFSNYPVWYELIEEKLTLSRYLDWTFVSCRTGLRKPDPEAYHHAARHLGVPAERCIFIDDRVKNTDAAVAVGMRSILREDTAQLQRALVALGVPEAG